MKRGIKMSGMTFASTERHDPYRNFNFSVDFVGKTSVIKSGFNSVTGVKWRADYIEVKEGGNNGIPDQIPTEERFEPITMRRGMSKISLLK
jgi:phage tail-like protein